MLAHFVVLYVVDKTFCIFNLINNCILFIVFAVHSKKMIKKRLVFGAIQTLNMPKKSHEIEPISSRRPLPDRPLQVTPSSNSCYKSLEELSNRARGLKCLADWVSKFSVAKAVRAVYAASS